MWQFRSQMASSSGWARWKVLKQVEVSYLKSQDGNGELGHGVGVLGQPSQHPLQVVWQHTAQPQLFSH